jgi:hypothetical protein
MRPGDDCIACHRNPPEGDPPIRDIMGTVFQELHDATNCRGLGASNYQVLIDIMNADGLVQFTLTANGGGNFFSSASQRKPSPYRAQVRLVDLDGNVVATRAMATPQTEGSCNSCHTETASGPADENIPPGRVSIAP